MSWLAKYLWLLLIPARMLFLLAPSVAWKIDEITTRALGWKKYRRPENWTEMSPRLGLLFLFAGFVGILLLLS